MPTIAEEVEVNPIDTAAKANKKWFRERADAWVKSAAKKFEKKHGYDPAAQVNKPGFSLAESRKQLTEKYKLSEGITDSQVFALAGYLVMDDMTKAYQMRPTIYRSLAKIVQSKSLEASFFAVQRGDIPVPVNEYEAIPESRLAGVLTRIRNYRYARIFSYSNELGQDDQTGSIRDIATSIGEGMAYAEEQAWVVSLFQAYQPANVRSPGPTGGIIPPMNIAGSAPAGYGGPVTTASPVTQVALENLYTAADYATDLEGNFALVDPNVGVFASADKIQVLKMLDSMYNPSVASTTPGAVGGIFSKNVLEGLFKPFFSPFVKRARAGIAGGNPWGIGEAGKIGAFQERTPLTVDTELAMAGRSFDENSTRVRAMRRFGTGVVLPEFFLVGN